MDQKLSQFAYNNLVEQAYPTLVLKLNQTCFKRCVSLGSSPKAQAVETSQFILTD